MINFHFILRRKKHKYKKIGFDYYETREREREREREGEVVYSRCLYSRARPARVRELGHQLQFFYWDLFAYRRYMSIYEVEIKSNFLQKDFDHWNVNCLYNFNWICKQIISALFEKLQFNSSPLKAETLHMWGLKRKRKSESF